MNPYQVWTGYHTIEIGVNLLSLGRWAILVAAAAFLIREYWIVRTVRRG